MFSWRQFCEAVRGKGLSICFGHAKWALYSTNHKPVLQLQTPCTLLLNASSDLIRHAGCLKHQDMLHVFSCEGYSKAEALFHLLWIWLLQWCTMGLETGRLKNATNCDRHRTRAMKETCLNSYNVNVRFLWKIHVVAIYPLAVNRLKVLWSMWLLQGRELQ